MLHGGAAGVWRSTMPVPFRYTLDGAPALYAGL